MIDAIIIVFIVVVFAVLLCHDNINKGISGTIKGCIVCGKRNGCEIIGIWGADDSITYEKYHKDCIDNVLNNSEKYSNGVLYNVRKVLEEIENIKRRRKLHISLIN